MTRRPRAFTLVELIVVIAVVAILASIAIPTVAGAVTPLARPVAELIECDLRRARLESMGSARETLLVVGEDRDSWWLQPTGEVTSERALPAATRVFGSGTLGPFAGHRISIAINGSEAESGDVVIARFDAEGTRDAATVVVTLVSPIAEAEMESWRIEPRRTRLRSEP